MTGRKHSIFWLAVFVMLPGLLVAHCTDAAAGWDGRDGLGRACPQGVYTYICKYRLAGGFAKRYLGSVALLR